MKQQKFRRSVLSICGLGLMVMVLGCSDSDDSDLPQGDVEMDGETCESDAYTGEGTYYDADGSGNCSFDPSPGDLMVAAMNTTDYLGSGACGACARITGPEGEVTVRIVDRCPECAPGDVDLSPQAFEQLSPLGFGRIPISWRYVSCNVTGSVVYHFKEGSNEWWSAVQVRNHRQAIAKFEYKDAGGQYREMVRTDYNYFLEEDGMGPGPYAFRITDVVGNIIEDSNIAFVEGGDVPGNSQFDGCQ